MQSPRRKMPAVIALLVILGLAPELLTTTATRDDVILELIKVFGIAISAGASCYAVYIANENRRAASRIETHVERKRRSVRHEDDENGGHTVIVEQKGENDISPHG